MASAVRPSEVVASMFGFVSNISLAFLMLDLITALCNGVTFFSSGVNIMIPAAIRPMANTMKWGMDASPATGITIIFITDDCVFMARYMAAVADMAPNEPARKNVILHDSFIPAPAAVPNTIINIVMSSPDEMIVNIKAESQVAIFPLFLYWGLDRRGGGDGSM